MTDHNSGLSADTQALMAFEANKKSTGVAFLLWFFTGGLGGHRFYLGKTGSAVGQLVLSVLGWVTIWFVVGLLFLIPLGIWLLIDLFLISGMVESHNRELMLRLNARPKAAGSQVDELAKFAALRDQGAISDDEYDVQKRRLLGESPTPATVDA
ncbi:NINE protein [Brevundimonas sp. Root1279]|uniref:NINE protein n=1 Tax=Brevundimonas sp. Root1279 TaxID=1736443 RepID=UPI000AD43CA7|nr:NINE protein [Brevundimonas sp. Root1279]